MVRGQRRRSPGAPAALRWIAADARDVARIRPGATRPAGDVRTVARGVRRWQRRVERRRLLALSQRAALLGIAAACVLQVAALATGHSGAGAWLLPGVLVAALALAFGVAHRTTPSSAARLLDRDLALGARVTTALELETSPPDGASAHGLGALALDDGRAALAASLAFTRVRLQPRRGELASLAALVAAFAVLLAVPSPRTGSSQVAVPAKARTAPPSSRALRAENGLPATADTGPSLQGFKQAPLESPPLAAVQAGTTRSGGASSGHSPYGGGVGNNAAAGSSQPASRTIGQSGSVQGTEDLGSGSASASQGKGSLPNGSSGSSGESIPGGNSTSKGRPGSTSVAPVPTGRANGSAPGGSRSGTAGNTGGQSRGGIGSSAPGSAPGSKPGKTAPGGSTAGTQGGGKSRGTGVVPQLGGQGALPIAPGYEAIPGEKGATNESASSAPGKGGGAGHSGQAIAGAAGSGGGRGVPYVPPGGASVASIDRSVVLGYFASFARVNASGW